MTNKHCILPCPAVPGDFHVNLGHQGTSGIEYFQAALVSGFTHGLGNAVCTENHVRVIGYLVQFINKDRPGPCEFVDDETVVHYFVTDINRRAK